MAHKLLLSIYDEENKVYVEAQFSDGNPCQKCRVVVQDDKKNTLFDAVTNQEGVVVFSVAPNPPYTVTLFASMGHKAEEQFTPEIFLNLEHNPENTVAQDKHLGDEIGSVDAIMLRNIVGQEIRKHLNTIERRMDRREKEMTLERILSGVGYVVGFFGILSFIYRKKKL
jgi:hypothetical protein